jgi:hypothetical protein
MITFAKNALLPTPDDKGNSKVPFLRQKYAFHPSKSLYMFFLIWKIY